MDSIKTTTRSYGPRLVLTFHGVGYVPTHVGTEERRFWCAESQFHGLLDEVRLLSQTTVPIQLTFDDGNDTDVLVAMPALLDRQLTANFFICAGRLGERGYLDEDQIRRLRDAGMRSGSHGWGHLDWRRADDLAMDLELRKARERLSMVVGHDVDEVAIPFGSYDRRVVGMLRQTGVRTAYTSDGGWATDAGWMVPRQTWTNSWKPETLREVAASAGSIAERARRSIARIVKRLR